MAGGVHLNLFLFTAQPPDQKINRKDTARTGATFSSSCCFFKDYAKTYLKTTLTSYRVLRGSYFACLASSQVEKIFNEKLGSYLGQWHPGILEEVVEALDECRADWNEEEEEGEDLTAMADQIHALMDAVPVAPNDYRVVDVHWMVGSAHLSPPSAALGLVGALHRLRVDFRAHVNIIVPEDCQDKDTLDQWKEYGCVARVWSAIRWMPLTNVFWHGSINIKNSPHTTTTAATDNITVSGFALCPAPGTADSALLPHVLDRIGLHSDFYPTHLVFLEVVDTSTLPLCCLSPLQCRLSTTSCSTKAAKLFKSFSSPMKKNLGYLFRLCCRQLSEVRNTRTTAEWKSHILTNEEAGAEVHFLGSCETGPVLLVWPNDGDGEPETYESCEACFLWKPETSSLGDMIACHSDCGEDLFRKLPVLDGITASEKEELSPVMLDDAVDSVQALFRDKSPQSQHKLDLFLFEKERMLREPVNSDLMESSGHTPAMSTISGHTSTPPTFPGHIISAPPTVSGQQLLEHISALPAIAGHISTITSPTTSGHTSAPPTISSGQPCEHTPALPTVASSSATGQPEAVGVAKVLQCFTETGLAANAAALSPIKLTTPSKMHHTGAGDLSYQTIAFSTPSRKKRKYHGINYCLSDRDAFRDSQLTRIQNSCLSSERASHCSTVTTPRKTSRMPWGQHRRTPRRTPQKHQQLRELHRNKKLQARRERVRREAGAQSKAGTREGEETAVTTQGSNINGESRSAVSARTVKDKVLVPNAATISCRRRLPIAGGTAASLSSSSSSSLSSSSSSKQKNGPDGGGAKEKTEGRSVLVKTKGERSTEGSAEDKREESLKSKKRKRELKSALEKAVVDALKKSGMPRSHQHFRACYNRLFHLSKTFIKDMNTANCSPSALKKEMTDIVKFNVQNVIDFQQKLQQK